MLVRFLSSLVLCFSTNCYGCHQLAPDLRVSQQVSTIFPSKPALYSFWGCLPHPEVEFHAALVGGMGGCAMIGQSVINVTSGGRGRLSTFTAGATLLVLLWLLGIFGIAFQH